MDEKYSHAQGLTLPFVKSWKLQPRNSVNTPRYKIISEEQRLGEGDINYMSHHPLTNHFRTTACITREMTRTPLT